MGLVWSAYGDGTSYAISLRTQPLFITAETGSETANIEVSRTLLTDEIACTDVRERGLYGRFFRPATGGPVPGVLVLGGSEGGLASYVMREAALLAGHGFAALALAYFYMGSLPDRLAGIPLEYFGGAIRWLQNQPSVRGDRLGVVGTSRGGELALLLGAHFPDLEAVVSYVGSGLVFPSPAGPKPAWTFRGKALPWISNPFDILQAKPEQFERAEIPVERTNGPVLVISGDADQVWPSTQLSQVAMDRLGATSGLTATSFAIIPTQGTASSHRACRRPPEPITSAEVWRATPPPTKIPGDACSACSMDVCGADVLASSVKQALREGDVDRDRHGCQDHAEDQQLSQGFTPSTAARGRALAESRASRTGRPRRQGFHGCPSRRRCRLRSRGPNLRC
jgi:dienelactone hydrolase